MKALITLLGRTLLATIFILSALSKIGDNLGSMAYMESRGIPFTPFLLYGAVFLELAGGLSLVTGYRARLGALCLALFLIPVTYFFHFQLAIDPSVSNADHKIQMIHTLKNLAIMGGLLLVSSNGPGALSIGKD